MFQKGIASVLLFAFLIVGARFDIAFADTNQSVFIANYFQFAFNMNAGITRSPDVMYLKRLLNNDPRTRIATDPCMSDDIDSYYDQRTKNAVYRFQQLYGGERIGLVRAPTGNVGPYTRAAMNQLMKTSTYSNIMASSSGQALANYLNAATQNTANGTPTNPAVAAYLNQVNNTIRTSSTTLISTSSPVNPNLPQNVQNYLNQVNQITATATGSASTTPPRVAPSNIPAVNTYGNNVNQVINTGTNAINSQASTNSPTSTSAFVPVPLLTPIPGGNEGIQNYFNNANNALQSYSSSQSNQSGQTPPSNQSVANYLNVSTQILNQNGAAPIIASGTPVSNFDPTLITINPTTITNCQQNITITGENLSTSTNLVFGSLGSLIVPSTTLSQTSSGTIGSITFNLKQFSDYFYYQSMYAGTTRDIKLVVMANGRVADQGIVLRFTFPGEARSAAAISETMNYPGNTPDLRGSPQGGLGISPQAAVVAGNSSSGSLIRTIETFEKQVFKDTPHGISMQHIGGSGALDVAYGFRSNGQLNLALQGKTPGLVNLVGLGISGVNATSTSSGGGSNIGTAVGIAAAGIGLAAGVSALAGGGQAAVNQIVRGFGGRVIITYPCTCSFNFIVTLFDARGPVYQLMFQPGVSFLKMNFNIFTPGVNVLGTFLLGPSIPCLMYVGVACIPFGLPIGTILQVGTSVIPGV